MSSSVSSSNSLPEPIRALLDLFRGPLAEVRFPDVDRDTLTEAEAEVERRRAELAQALEVVQSARESLEQGQQALLDQARRAHAYASVFAQDDASLSAALAEIKLDGRVLAPKKKRGRPRKKQASKRQTSLAVADDAA
jgi:hypothetical protein